MSNPKFPRAIALDVARELCAILKPACDRLIVAGSLRRRKSEVGDVEILFVPKMEWQKTGDLFAGSRLASAVDPLMSSVLSSGFLRKRPRSDGGHTWGGLIKLALQPDTGVPVDLFCATEENYWNYLVCRTGSAETNIRIASASKAKGWHWEPYSSGFSCGAKRHHVHAEREVFDFCALDYLEPWER